MIFQGSREVLQFTLSDHGMEEAFFDTPLYREFAQLDQFSRLPDEPTILRFCHRLEKHKLAEQILATVNALLTQRGLLLKAAISASKLGGSLQSGSISPMTKDN